MVILLWLWLFGLCRKHGVLNDLNLSGWMLSMMLAKPCPRRGASRGSSWASSHGPTSRIYYGRAKTRVSAQGTSDIRPGLAHLARDMHGGTLLIDSSIIQAIQVPRQYI